jgi:hypothetical protein
MAVAFVLSTVPPPASAPMVSLWPPVKVRLAPVATVTVALSPMARLAPPVLLIWRVPASTLMSPVWVLMVVPPRMSVPVSALVSVPLPARMPL